MNPVFYLILFSIKKAAYRQLSLCYPEFISLIMPQGVNSAAESLSHVFVQTDTTPSIDSNQFFQYHDIGAIRRIVNLVKNEHMVSTDLTRLVGKLSVSLDKYLESKWNSIISKYTPWFEVYAYLLFCMTEVQE